jgi:hypothetical protein
VTGGNRSSDVGSESAGKSAYAIENRVRFKVFNAGVRRDLGRERPPILPAKSTGAFPIRSACEPTGGAPIPPLSPRLRSFVAADTVVLVVGFLRTAIKEPQRRHAQACRVRDGDRGREQLYSLKYSIRTATRASTSSSKPSNGFDPGQFAISIDGLGALHQCDGDAAMLKERCPTVLCREGYPRPVYTEH